MKQDSIDTRIGNKLNFSFSKEVPLVLQSTATECGLACLSMITGFYGKHISLADLRGKFKISLKGMTLRQLSDAANKLGLKNRAIRLELDELSELKLPVIAHWNLNHFVVITKIKKNHVWVCDPDYGRRKISFDELSKNFTGVALEIWPENTFSENKESKKIKLSDVIGNISGFKRNALKILAISFLLEIIGILMPLFSQGVIDHAIGNYDTALLKSLTIAFAGIVILQQAVSIYRSWIMMYIGTLVSTRWRYNIFDHLIRLPLSYFEQRHIGDINSRFDSSEKILQTLSSTFFSTILDGVMCLVTLIMMMMYSPILGCIAIGAMFSYAILRIVFYPHFRNISKENIVKASQTQTYFLETIRGIRPISFYSKQEVRKSSWINKVIEQVNASIGIQKLQLLFTTCNTVIFGIEGVLVLYFGGQLVIEHTLSLGMLVAFISYKSSFNSRIAVLIDNFISLKMLRIHVERLADIITTKPSNSLHNILDTTIDGLNGDIEFERVTFRYAHAEPTIISAASFKIKEGESVAIIGKTGGGKTTLLNIMIGVLKPNRGSIFFGGKEITEENTDLLRRNSSIVMQDDSLFAGSLLENITFWDEEIDYDWVDECIETCQLKNEIQNFPMGLQTLVGDMGSVLSGGQKQRVLLARALYRRPKILFLDEATSSLDSETEELINNKLKEMKITRIFIAHRKSTIDTADRVMYVDSGRVISL